jgi:hypothetical protein
MLQIEFPNFVTKCYVESYFFKEISYRLCLTRAAGDDIIITRFMVERRPLFEAPLYLAETWYHDVDRRNDCGENFRRSSKAYRTLCWLCERVGIVLSIFELDSVSPSDSLRSYVLKIQKERKISNLGKNYR